MIPDDKGSVRRDIFALEMVKAYIQRGYGPVAAVNEGVRTADRLVAALDSKGELKDETDTQRDRESGSKA